MDREHVHLWIDCLTDIGERLRPTLLPRQAEQHFQQAMTVGLKGMRALLDAEIAQRERSHGDLAASQQGACSAGVDEQHGNDRAQLKQTVRSQSASSPIRTIQIEE